MVETKGKTLEEMSRLFGIEEKLATNSGVDHMEVLAEGRAKGKDQGEERVEEVIK